MSLFPPSQVRTPDTNQTERHVVKYEKSAGEESLRAIGAVGRSICAPNGPRCRPGPTSDPAMSQNVTFYANFAGEL